MQEEDKNHNESTVTRIGAEERKVIDVYDEYEKENPLGDTETEESWIDGEWYAAYIT